MENSKTAPRTDKKILVVGELGYHEDNITLPILEELERLDIEYHRSGGNFDFFIPSNKELVIQSYVDSLKVNLADYSLVFFVDFWNMVIPIFNYKRSLENPQIPFISLLHGSVNIFNDVANNINNAVAYEKYLVECYEHIIVAYPSQKSLIKKNCTVIPFPSKRQFERQRKEIKAIPRIIYAHRLDVDKGVLEFLDFVSFCIDTERQFEFIVAGDINSSKIVRNHAAYKHLQHTGKRVSQEELEELCKEGGYAWSSAHSEIFAYTILDLCSYGLTPMLNYISGYECYRRTYKYRTFEEACTKIEAGVTMPNSQWYDIEEKIGRGEIHIALLIKNTRR